jgi:hypothetical protein
MVSAGRGTPRRRIVVAGGLLAFSVVVGVVTIAALTNRESAADTLWRYNGDGATSGSFDGVLVTG